LPSALAGRGSARLGRARHGEARMLTNTARLGKARHGAAWQGQARLGKDVKTRRIKLKLETQKIKVKLAGVTDIMFDRFHDHSKEVRPPEQKLYLDKDNNLVLPTENIMTFLVGDLNPGCAKVFEGRKSKDYIRTLKSHLNFGEIYKDLIPFTDGSGKIKFKKFGEKLRIFAASPVTKASNGALIKQEKKDRPVLQCPWYLSFSLELIDNPLINENKLYNYFTRGGILIALGTYRPRFGRFVVEEWELQN
jgi:hypothetical protein